MLLDAIEKDASNTDTLVNLIACSQHQRSDELVKKYISDLQRVAPNHPFVKKNAETFKKFDEMVLKYVKK